MTRSEGETIGICDHRSILPLLRQHCRDRKMTLSSCLDVGCGRTRFDRWVATASDVSEPRRYIGLEVDPKIREELLAEGLDVRDPFSPEGRDSDGELGTALEIIEHLEPDETVPFLREYLARTRRLFALTTPNCEYWTDRKPNDDVPDLHFIPDHFLDLYASQSSPHSHKQAFTPASVAAVLQQALPDERWKYRVYRAWPWTITDVTRPVTYTLHYKIFALAWLDD